MIRLRNSDYRKISERIDHVLYNTRISLNEQSKDWKGWAEGKEVTILSLRETIIRAIQTHRTKLIAISSVKTKHAPEWSELMNLVRGRGNVPDTEVDTLVSEYLTLLNKIEAMPKNNFRELIAIADLINAEVSPPIDLWPL